jgi:hypothetical protein
MRLFEFTSEEDHEYGKQGRRPPRIGRRCMRCGGGIPRCEGDVYDGSGLCGWCYHMYQKLIRE